MARHMDVLPGPFHGILNCSVFGALYELCAENIAC